MSLAGLSALLGSRLSLQPTYRSITFPQIDQYHVGIAGVRWVLPMESEIRKEIMTNGPVRTKCSVWYAG